jgi:hypothetical protein
VRGTTRWRSESESERGEMRETRKGEQMRQWRVQRMWTSVRLIGMK